MPLIVWEKKKLLRDGFLLVVIKERARTVCFCDERWCLVRALTSARESRAVQFYGYIYIQAVLMIVCNWFLIYSPIVNTCTYIPLSFDVLTGGAVVNYYYFAKSGDTSFLPIHERDLWNFLNYYYTWKQRFYRLYCIRKVYFQYY